MHELGHQEHNNPDCRPHIDNAQKLSFIVNVSGIVMQALALFALSWPLALSALSSLALPLSSSLTLSSSSLLLDNDASMMMIIMMLR